MLIRERPRVIVTGQPCGAEQPYSPGQLSSHMGHTAAVPLTPPLAGFLLPTLNYCTWRGEDFREGVAVVVYSGDEQRYTDGGQHCGLPGHDLCWRKGQLGPRGSTGRLDTVLLSSLQSRGCPGVVRGLTSCYIWEPVYLPFPSCPFPGILPVHCSQDENPCW